jgi:hypothetical protein
MLRALAAGGMQVAEFFGVFMRRVPAWKKQNQLRRQLTVLLNDWEQESAPESKPAVARVLRAVAREAVNQAS